MSKDFLNIDEALGKRATLGIAPEESPEEREARLKREASQHKYEMVRSYVLLFTILPAIIGIGGFCFYVAVFDSNAQLDTKRWTQTIVTALVSGSLSFLLGQQAAKKGK